MLNLCYYGISNGEQHAEVSYVQVMFTQCYLEIYCIVLFIKGLQAEIAAGCEQLSQFLREIESKGSELNAVEKLGQHFLAHAKVRKIRCNLHKLYFFLIQGTTSNFYTLWGCLILVLLLYSCELREIFPGLLIAN